GSPRVKRSLIEVIGRIGGRAAEEILLDELKTTDRDLVLEVSKALERCSYRPSGATVPIFRSLLDSELASHAEMLLAERDFAEIRGADLLLDALEGERERTSLRILLLLSFLYDGLVMREIRDRLASRQRDQIT